jgi:hypothetical protein
MPGTDHPRSMVVCGTVATVLTYTSPALVRNAEQTIDGKKGNHC